MSLERRKIRKTSDYVEAANDLVPAAARDEAYIEEDDIHRVIGGISYQNISFQSQCEAGGKMTKSFMNRYLL